MHLDSQKPTAQFTSKNNSDILQSKYLGDHRFSKDSATIKNKNSSGKNSIQISSTVRSKVVKFSNKFSTHQSPLPSFHKVRLNQQALNQASLDQLQDSLVITNLNPKTENKKGTDGSGREDSFQSHVKFTGDPLITTAKDLPSDDMTDNILSRN